MTIHVAVMTQEAIDALAPKVGGRYLDGTLGGGTHSRALLQASAPTGRVVSLDVDRKALERAGEAFAAYGDRWKGVEANFRHMDRVAVDHDMISLDGVLLDLGFSSDELEDSSKGISFMKDGPLDMRLGPLSNDDGMTAAEIVNTWTVQDIERVISNFGEDPNARRIAKGIVDARKAARIIGTLDLASVITRVVPHVHSHIHPATRTFQALRIVVNDEIEALKEAIQGAHRILAPEGRLAIITFHSLEDRIVKQAFTDEALWDAITEKPLIPSDEEVAGNPRSRSAKLRVAKKRA